MQASVVRCRDSAGLARLHKRMRAYLKVACTATSDLLWRLIQCLLWDNEADERTHRALRRCGISRDDSCNGSPPSSLRHLGSRWTYLMSGKRSCQRSAAHDNNPTVPSCLALVCHEWICSYSIRQSPVYTTLTHSSTPYPSFSRSEEAAKLTLTILKTMTSHHIPLQLYTYRSLITDHFVTLQLTKYLRTRMTHDGVVPTADHLEAYPRIFSDTYLRAIQEYCVKHSLAPPYATAPLHSTTCTTCSSRKLGNARSL
ncbi:hypothetical protein EDC04DRAFT_2704446 [Pisolithus marmoratus]|nr:hypothetical protein EDC04DRAFT_2704446 [Pisolithus marmoratus]